MTINITQTFLKITHLFQRDKFQQFSFILFLAFVLCIPSAFADNCEATDGCMDFLFEDKVDNSDGTTTYCFSVTNNCDHALSYIAFSIPQAATSPVDNSTYSSVSGINYTIENTTNNPFLSIKFETVGEGFKNGEEGRFCFDLPSSIDYNSITIESKASTEVYTVAIDLSDCIGISCDELPPLNGGAAGVLSGGYPQSEATVFEGEPFVIQNVVKPSGGSGDLEIVWIKCTGSDGLSDCASRFEELLPINVGEVYNAYLENQGSPRIGETCWEFASDGDADDTSLNVADGLSSSSCFIRCVRYAGCVRFLGEGNLIAVTVQPGFADPNSSENTSEEEYTNRGFITYPNPAHDKVYVLADPALAGQEAEVVIYNRLGSVMMQTKTELKEYAPINLDTSKLPAGTYTVYLKLESRKNIAKKLIISRL